MGRKKCSLRSCGFCRTLSEGSYPIFSETKRSPKGDLFVSRRERDSNPRTCDSLRISRPAQSTTLASLQGSHNLVKISRFVYPRPHDRSSPARFLFLPPFETACRISTFGRESKKRIQQNFRFISASALRGFSRFSRDNRRQNHSIVRHGPQMKFTGPEGAL